MIIFHSDRALSREQMEVFRRQFLAARDMGRPVVLPPGWKVEEIAVPAMAGPLVDYLGQLGDA